MDAVRGFPIMYRGDTEHMKLTTLSPRSLIPLFDSKANIVASQHKLYSRSVDYEKPIPSQVYENSSTVPTTGDRNSTLSTLVAKTSKPTSSVNTTSLSIAPKRVPSTTSAYAKTTTTNDASHPSIKSSNPTTTSSRVRKPIALYTRTPATVSSKTKASIPITVSNSTVLSTQTRKKHDMKATQPASSTKDSDYSISSTAISTATSDVLQVLSTNASYETVSSTDELKNEFIRLISDVKTGSLSLKQTYTVPSNVALEYLAQASIIKMN